jgi:DnaD/phage-associated family protein
MINIGGRKMAQKRMFNISILESDEFLEMPDSSQILYIHLSMNADDDGFVDNWKSIMRMTGKKEDDLKILIAKSFVIPFNTKILIIRHWKLNNYIQKDRYKETIYKDEKALLSVDKNNVYNLDTNCIHSIDKNRLDKISIDKSSSSNINININNNSELNENDSCVDDFYLDDRSDSCVDGFQKVIDFYNNNIGLITPYTMELLDDYAKEMTNDVVVYALQLSVEANCRNLNYIKAILNNWNKAGVKNLIQAQEENQIHKKPSSNLNETQEEKNARRAKEIKEAMEKNATR